MLSDKERIAILENDRKWIRESLVRIEAAGIEAIESLGKHLNHHQRGSGSGLTLIVGRKTVVAAVASLFGGSGGLAWVIVSAL